jgi:hypothetical protein
VWQLGEIVADGNRFAQQTLDRLQPRPLLVVAQRDRLARHARPARAADAMHVGLRLVWQLVVDHVRDVVDVDAAGRNVGGDEHRRMLRLEGGERLLTLVLALVAMNCRRTDASLLEIPLELVGAMLRSREHDHAGHALGREQMHEQVPLLPLRQEKHCLRDRLRRRRLRRGLHLERIA